MKQRILLYNYKRTFVSRQSSWDNLLHVNKECPSRQTTLKQQTTAGFPFFLTLFLSQWSVWVMLCHWTIISQSEAGGDQSEAGDGLWWWVALTGGSCLRVTGPRPGGAGSGSEYYGVWGEEWVGTPALLRPPVSLSHYAQSHSEAETDDEMTSDLGNLESPPDQWSGAFKVKIVELKWDESVKRIFCEQWWNVKVCKHFKILK